MIGGNRFIKSVTLVVKEVICIPITPKHSRT